MAKPVDSTLRTILPGTNGTRTYDASPGADGLIVQDTGQYSEPSAPFHVRDSADDVSALVETAKANGVAGLNLKNDAQETALRVDASDNLVVADVTNSKTPVTIEANALTDSLYIDSSGNVGIGVANPTDPLEINLPTNNLGIVDATMTGGNNGNGRITYNVGGATRYVSFD